MEFNFNTKSEILNFNFMHDTQKNAFPNQWFLDYYINIAIQSKNDLIIIYNL